MPNNSLSDNLATLVCDPLSHRDAAATLSWAFGYNHTLMRQGPRNANAKRSNKNCFSALTVYVKDARRNGSEL
jgi:hypothetical protein